MGREIITTKLARLPRMQAAPEPDPWAAKVLKLIPGDIVSVYLAVFTLVQSQGGENDQTRLVQWIIFGVIALIAPFYLRKVANIQSKRQIVLIEISFFIWVLSIGGPLSGLSWGKFTPQFLGAIILPIYTLVIPIFYDEK
jgi:hypothetical protein